MTGILSEGFGELTVQGCKWTSIKTEKKEEDDSFLGSASDFQINCLLMCKMTLKTSLREICIHNGELSLAGDI